MKYEVIKKEYVIETLGKGNTVIACDFDTMRMVNCENMTINAIKSFIARDNTVFYKGIANG